MNLWRLLQGADSIVISLSDFRHRGSCSQIRCSPLVCHCFVFLTKNCSQISHFTSPSFHNKKTEKRLKVSIFQDLLRSLGFSYFVSSDGYRLPLQCYCDKPSWEGVEETTTNVVSHRRALYQETLMRLIHVRIHAVPLINPLYCW